MLLENNEVRKKILKYSIPLVLNSIINTVYGLLLIVGYSHIDEKVSLVVLALNSLNFLLLGSLGYLSSALQIENKKNDDKNRLYSSAFTCAILLGFTLLGIILALGERFCSFYYSFTANQLENAYIYIIFVGISSILTLLIFVTNSILKINEKTAVLGKINLISSLVSVLAFIFVILFNPTIVSIGMWSLIYPFVCLIISYWTMKLTIKFKFVKFDWKIIVKLLKSTFVMGIQELFDTTILLFFLESLLANYNHNIYQSYLINMQLLNYMMIPIYMISSSLYVYIQNREEDSLFFTVSLKLNTIIYTLMVLTILGAIKYVYILFVPKEILFDQFTVVFFLLFASNIMLPCYITYRTLAQCYDLAGKLVIPTISINLLTITVLLVLNVIVPNIIFISFIVIGTNYLLLTFLTRMFVLRRPV